MSLGSFKGGAFSLEDGYDFAATKGTTITANSTVNTVGSYVELVSAANNTLPSNNIIIEAVNTAATNPQDTNFLVNIAIGGAGNEVNIIKNLMVKGSPAALGVNLFRFDFPIKIPNGVRISANCQCSLTAEIIDVTIIRTHNGLGSDHVLSIIDNAGSITATSKGTTVARSTADTFGSWVEIIASTSDCYEGFIIAAQRPPISYNTQTITYQVAIGSAGNEEIILSGFQVYQGTSEGAVGQVTPFQRVSIPEGVRISIRAQSDVADADGDLDYSISLGR